MNRTPERVTLFCAALAETCQVGKAAEAIGMSRSAVYNWRVTDPEFAKAWDQAMKVGTLRLEDAMHDRAIEGIEEPIYHNGNQVGTMRKYSDTLAIFLAKAHAPEKYRERTEVKHAGSIALGTMTDEELQAEIAALVAKQGDDLV